MTDQPYYIRNIERPTADTIVLELCRPVNFKTPHSGSVFDFKPGQYIMISYRDEYGNMTDRHAFSIASSPTQKDSLKLGIRVGGKFTRGLARMNPGDEIMISGPYGKFVFNPRKHRDLVMIAGGIGITPFLSAMHYATDHSLSNKLSLLYSNKTLSGTLFFDEIKYLESANPNIRTLFCVTEKFTSTTSGVVNKRINPAVIDDFVGNVKGKTFFLCGPAPFMSAMKSNLQILGVDKHQIEMEEFAMLQNFDISTAFKSSAYALAVSGALILLPLYLFVNHADASGDSTGYGSIFSSGSPYSISNIYRLGKQEYQKLTSNASVTAPEASRNESATNSPAIAATTTEMIVATPPPAPKTDKPASKQTPKTAAKATTPKVDPKTTIKPTQNTVSAKIITAPKPTTAVSPAILAEQQAAAQNALNQTQTTAPSPVTAASATRASSQTTQTQQTNTQTAPAPATSASTVPSGSTSGSTGPTVTNPTPSPVTSASGVTSGGTTGSGSTIGGSTSGSGTTAHTSPTFTRRNHDDDD